MGQTEWCLNCCHSFLQAHFYVILFTSSPFGGTSGVNQLISWLVLQWTIIFRSGDGRTWKQLSSRGPAADENWAHIMKATWWNHHDTLLLLTVCIHTSSQKFFLTLTLSLANFNVTWFSPKKSRQSVIFTIKY